MRQHNECCERQRQFHQLRMQVFRLQHISVHDLQSSPAYIIEYAEEGAQLLFLASGRSFAFSMLSICKT